MNFGTSTSLSIFFFSFSICTFFLTFSALCDPYFTTLYSHLMMVFIPHTNFAPSILTLTANKSNIEKRWNLCYYEDYVMYVFKKRIMYSDICVQQFLEKPGQLYYLAQCGQTKNLVRKMYSAK